MPPAADIARTTSLTTARTVIPDLHADPHLLARLMDLADPSVPLAFLGDFIDGAKRNTDPDDRAVLECVRGKVDDGAVAVMGNHELNAILYHRLGKDGLALRTHSERNKAQHRSFVRQFGTATPDALAWTDWFLTLPLWLDLGGLRLVHACWSQPDIDLIAARRPDARLTEADLPEVAAGNSDFARAVLNLVTGPELPLPEGYAFHDAHGHKRQRVRIAWWRSSARRWRDAALSVPHPDELPDGLVPQSNEVAFYPKDAPPVLLGHYKMQGAPRLEGPVTACLDYPGTGCIYEWRGEKRLNPAHLRVPEQGDGTS